MCLDLFLIVKQGILAIFLQYNSRLWSYKIYFWILEDIDL